MSKKFRKNHGESPKSKHQQNCKKNNSVFFIHGLFRRNSYSIWIHSGVDLRQPGRQLHTLSTPKAVP